MSLEAALALEAETNISHLGNRKIIFKIPLGRGYVSSQDNDLLDIEIRSPSKQGLVGGFNPFEKYDCKSNWLEIFFPKGLGWKFQKIFEARHHLVMVQKSQRTTTCACVKNPVKINGCSTWKVMVWKMSFRLGAWFLAGAVLVSGSVSVWFQQNDISLNFILVRFLKPQGSFIELLSWNPIQLYHTLVPIEKKTTTYQRKSTHICRFCPPKLIHPATNKLNIIPKNLVNFSTSPTSKLHSPQQKHYSWGVSLGSITIQIAHTQFPSKPTFFGTLKGLQSHIF